MNLTGKIVLVTGAAGDLGSVVVQALLDAGAAGVVALDIDPAKLALFTDARITKVTGDLSHFDSANHALDEAYARHEKIDVLVNAAGILYSAPLVNMLEKSTEYLRKAAEEWQRCIAINLSSVFYTTQLVAHRMMKSRIKGVIINFSSVTAAGNSGQSAYSAAKAGVNALAKVWAKELAPLGIRSVAIAPGYIDTRSTHKAVSETQINDIKQRVPLKKLGSPDSIAQTVLFAIANDYLTGTVLDINGGLVI